MSHFPNKPTLVAAALYGASALPNEESTDKTQPPAVWADLSEDQRKPFTNAASYLLGQTFGVAPHLVNRAVLAKSFDAQKFPAFADIPSVIVVSIFVNVVSALPS